MIGRTSRATKPLVTSLGTVRFKSKVVDVQLLKDFKDLGYAGQIVKVTPGRMRQHLHPNGIASWIIEGQPTKIPVRTAEDVREMLAAKLEAQRNAPSRARADSNIASKATRPAEKNAKKFLSFLNMPQASAGTASTPATASALKIAEALDTLPPVITISVGPSTDGSLETAYTRQDLSKYVSSLLGVTVPSGSITFEIATGPKSTAPSKVVDHTGRFQANFQVDEATRVVKTIKLRSAEGVDTDRPHSRPLPEEPAELAEEPVSAAPAPATPPKKAAAEADSTSESESAGTPSFQWQNKFISRS